MLIQKDHSLDKAFNEVHDQLKRAGVDTRHKFRFFSVATVNASKKIIPQSRMVVLRSFSDDWAFEFYTDHRTSKVEEIESNPIISALFWDPSKRVQVRIEAEAAIHNQDDLAESRWKDVQGDAQKAYTPVVSPGSVVDKPEDAHKWPDAYRYDYFTVIVCSAVKIKALQLSGMEHLAFLCKRSHESDSWDKNWIAP
ncbi:pyridoxamine 5'-phosphate oxidase family protein [Rhodohalobacter sp. 8-1]|uniref:pyridoxamine 5'-phosphate oxidase family protein n=1 Tax=Rhodohalobacter sp. 8-1 TaxID=3131972 RepID=UPI0030EBEA0F